MVTVRTKRIPPQGGKEYLYFQRSKPGVTTRGGHQALTSEYIGPLDKAVSESSNWFKAASPEDRADLKSWLKDNRPDIVKAHEERLRAEAAAVPRGEFMEGVQAHAEAAESTMVTPKEMGIKKPKPQATPSESERAREVLAGMSAGGWTEFGDDEGAALEELASTVRLAHPDRAAGVEEILQRHARGEDAEALFGAMQDLANNAPGVQAGLRAPPGSPGYRRSEAARLQVEAGQAADDVRSKALRGEATEADVAAVDAARHLINEEVAREAHYDSIRNANLPAEKKARLLAAAQQNDADETVRRSASGTLKGRRFARRVYEQNELDAAALMQEILRHEPPSVATRMQDVENHVPIRAFHLPRVLAIKEEREQNVQRALAKLKADPSYAAKDEVFLTEDRNAGSVTLAAEGNVRLPTISVVKLGTGADQRTYSITRDEGLAFQRAIKQGKKKMAGLEVATITRSAKKDANVQAALVRLGSAKTKKEFSEASQGLEGSVPRELRPAAERLTVGYRTRFDRDLMVRGIISRSKPVKAASPRSAIDPEGEFRQHPKIGTVGYDKATVLAIGPKDDMNKAFPMVSWPDLAPARVERVEDHGPTGQSVVLKNGKGDEVHVDAGYFVDLVRATPKDQKATLLMAGPGYPIIVDYANGERAVLAPRGTDEDGRHETGKRLDTEQALEALRRPFEERAPRAPHAAEKRDDDPDDEAPKTRTTQKASSTVPGVTNAPPKPAAQDPKEMRARAEGIRAATRDWQPSQTKAEWDTVVQAHADLRRDMMAANAGPIPNEPIPNHPGLVEGSHVWTFQHVEGEKTKDGAVAGVIRLRDTEGKRLAQPEVEIVHNRGDETKFTGQRRPLDAAWSRERPSLWSSEPHAPGVINALKDVDAAAKPHKGSARVMHLRSAFDDAGARITELLKDPKVEKETVHAAYHKRAAAAMRLQEAGDAAQAGEPERLINAFEAARRAPVATQRPNGTPPGELGAIQRALDDLEQKPAANAETVRAELRERINTLEQDAKHRLAKDDSTAYGDLSKLARARARLDGKPAPQPSTPLSDELRHVQLIAYEQGDKKIRFKDGPDGVTLTAPGRASIHLTKEAAEAAKQLIQEAVWDSHNELTEGDTVYVKGDAAFAPLTIVGIKPGNRVVIKRGHSPPESVDEDTIAHIPKFVTPPTIPTPRKEQAISSFAPQGGQTIPAAPADDLLERHAQERREVHTNYDQKWNVLTPDERKMTNGKESEAVRNHRAFKSGELARLEQRHGRELNSYLDPEALRAASARRMKAQTPAASGGVAPVEAPASAPPADDLVVEARGLMPGRRKDEISRLEYAGTDQARLAALRQAQSEHKAGVKERRSEEVKLSTDIAARMSDAGVMRAYQLELQTARENLDLGKALRGEMILRGYDDVPLGGGWSLARGQAAVARKTAATARRAELDAYVQQIPDPAERMAAERIVDQAASKWGGRMQMAHVPPEAKARMQPHVTRLEAIRDAPVASKPAPATVTPSAPVSAPPVVDLEAHGVTIGRARMMSMGSKGGTEDYYTVSAPGLSEHAAELKAATGQQSMVHDPNGWTFKTDPRPVLERIYANKPAPSMTTPKVLDKYKVEGHEYTVERVTGDRVWMSDLRGDVRDFPLSVIGIAAPAGRNMRDAAENKAIPPPPAGGSPEARILAELGTALGPLSETQAGKALYKMSNEARDAAFAAERHAKRWPKNAPAKAAAEQATRRARVLDEEWVRRRSKINDIMRERRLDWGIGAHERAKAAISSIPEQMQGVARVIAMRVKAEEIRGVERAALAAYGAKKEEMGLTHVRDSEDLPDAIMPLYNEHAAAQFATRRVLAEVDKETKRLSEPERVKLADFARVAKAAAEATQPPRPSGRPEKAAAYVRGEKGMQPFALLEKDFLKYASDAAEDRYKRNVDGWTKTRDTAKPGTKAHTDAKLQVELNQTQLDRVKSGDWQAKNETHYRTEYVKLVKQAISKGMQVPKEVVAQHSEFRLSLDARERYEKGRHTSFGNKSAAVDYSTRDTRGYKVKRQDGKAITPTQIQEVARGMDEVERTVGPLSELLRSADVTIAHTSGTYPFLEQAGGLYVSGEKTVTIGITSKRTGKKIPSLAHELAGHWLDYEAGEAVGASNEIRNRGTGGKRITTSLAEQDVREGNDGGKLITRAKDLMRSTRGIDHLANKNPEDLTDEEEALLEVSKVKLGPYWREPQEIWARLVEQFVSTEIPEGDLVSAARDYTHNPAYWSATDFAQLKPLVKEQMERRLRIIRAKSPPTAEAVASS